MSKLPPGWAETQFGNLGEIRLGKMLDKRKNQGVQARYLRNINVRWFRFDLRDLQTLLLTPDERNELSIRDGDLLICEGGEPGRCAVWRQGTNDLTYQKALHRVRFHNGVIPEFFMYQLAAAAATGHLKDAFTGTTIKHLTGESLKKYSVRLAPIAEQRRLVEKLQSLFRRIDLCGERLQKVPQILKRLREAVLEAAVSGRLTEEWRESGELVGWHEGTFATLLDQGSGGIRRGPFGSTIKRSLFVPSGYKVYEQGNAIYNDCQRGSYYIAEDLYQALSSFHVRPGDFIASCAGTIGKIAELPADAPAGVINQALVRIRIDRSTVDREFFLILFRSPSFQASILERTQGGAMQNLAPIKTLKTVRVVIPPLEEQREIVRRVKDLGALADTLETGYRDAASRLDELTPAVLAKAYRGELVPQHPGEEPATALLETVVHRGSKRRDSQHGEIGARRRQSLPNSSIVGPSQRTLSGRRKRA